MRSLFVVLLLVGVSHADSVDWSSLYGPPVSPTSATFNSDVADKLARLEAGVIRLEKAVAASQAVSADVPKVQAAPVPVKAGQTAYFGNRWYTSNGDGTYRECAECNAGLSGAAGVCPAGTCGAGYGGSQTGYGAGYSGPQAGYGAGSCGSGAARGPVRRLFRGLFGRCGGG